MAKQTEQQKILERNEQMLRVIEGLSPHERKKHFDMSMWGYVNECGTVCCVAGHCGLDTWFRRRGLKLVFDHYGKDFGRMVLHGSSTIGLDLDEFFGRGATEEIFYNDNIRTVPQAIRAIKARIKRLKQELQ